MDAATTPKPPLEHPLVEEEDSVNDRDVHSRKRLREEEDADGRPMESSAAVALVEAPDPSGDSKKKEVSVISDSTTNEPSMEEKSNVIPAPVENSFTESSNAAAVTTDNANETAPPPSMADTTEAATPLPTPRLHTQNASYESLRWVTVTNDGSASSMIRLIGLKSLFAKQLPKMPRAYIARLVLDRHHTSLAIVSSDPAVDPHSDDAIVGGICYRTFPEQRFAEIAFCAVHATHQVKGYGTKLMNLLKQTAARQGIEYFITYADNYAIGYFKKQGFTKQITMPKGRYFGLIKDYDGGTPMECYVHPSIDYYHIPELLDAQRNFLLARIARTALSATTVYPPPPPSDAAVVPSLHWTNDVLAASGGGLAVSRHHAIAAQALTIPGVLEAGWTLSDLVQSTQRTTDDMKQKSQALKQELLALIRKIEEQQFAWPFREPVDPQDAPDYYEVIAQPMDLRTMTQRVRQDQHYKNKRMLYHDVRLMVENCKSYNEDGSIYMQCAVALEKYAQTLFHDVLPA